MARTTSRSLDSGSPFTRRDFTRLLGFGGAAALLAHPAFARQILEQPRQGSEPLAAPAHAGDEPRWKAIREQFLMPSDLHLFNAANLCPSPGPVLRALADYTHRMDARPSPDLREEMHKVKEATRRQVASWLRVAPAQVLLTRNTSEGNNFVSNGLDLRSGDEVVIFADNHPSNHAAWREKAKRFGYTVRTIDQPCPHPGPEYYLEAVRRAMTARTKVLAFSHVTNTVGDLLPARALCALAREHGVLSLVDGAQTLGVLDIDLSDMEPDFYAGSAHKWPCGPLEAGVLYVNPRAQDRLWPTVISLYAGEVGLSKTFEGLGQRDEPSLLAFGEAIGFQARIGLPAIESRARALAQQLKEQLRPLGGVTVWTHADPARSGAVVAMRPASLDPRALAARLFEKDGIVCAVRAGDDRGGLRFSPHFYNSPAEIEAAVSALHRELR